MTKKEMEKQIESQMMDTTNICGIKCKSMKNKPVIAQEMIEAVYFKNSSETDSHCLERIKFLISSSQKKLIEYQNNHKSHAPWGPPILARPKKLANDSLMKEQTPNYKFKNYLRKQKVPEPTVLNQDQFEYICSDSESNVISPNDSDEDWIFEDKGKSRKTFKRKSITVERVSQNSDNKSKKNKVNNEKHNSTKDLSLDEITKVEALPPHIIEQIVENKFAEESKSEANRPTTCDFKIIAKTPTPSKSFRKSFQIKSTNVPTPSNTDNQELNKKEDSSNELVATEETLGLCNRLKRSIEKDTNLKNHCDEKKRKLSETIAIGNISPSSQDIFAIEDDEPEINENKPGSSKEMVHLQPEGNLSMSETRLKEMKKPADNLEVTIINDILCPICNQPFSLKDIEVHASDCDGLVAPVADECDTIFERRLRTTSRR